MAVPKTFVGGERLFAEDLNNNFNDLDSRASANAAAAENASNLTFGTVPAERLPTIPVEKLPAVPEGNLPYKIRRGANNGSSSSGGVTVTFPAGSFTSPPIVATVSITTAQRLNNISAPTDTGFTLYTYQLSGAYNAHFVHWIAVGT
jgi:hypothetical protein